LMTPEDEERLLAQQEQTNALLAGFGGVPNQSTGKVFCGRHPEKEIEYFCKYCHQIVCPKCMFSEHNGHELAQLEDVTGIIKQNVYDLHKLMINTKRINDDNRSLILHVREEI
jgi:hypothetical protein